MGQRGRHERESNSRYLFNHCLFSIFSPFYSNAEPLDNWYLRNTLSGDSLESVIYGNGRFVGVGGNDVWTSPNGATWTKGASGTNNTLYQVVYGNSKFVAVGSSGTIITSPDGITWTSQISRTTNTLRGVAFGNGFFMAVGYSATVVTSPDGTTWTLRTPNTIKSLQKLRYLNNLFVTIDYWSANILSSSDGTTWNESNIPQANWVPHDVAYGNNTYVVVGGYGEIFTSPNLGTWTERTTPGATTNSLYSVTCAIGIFAAVGAYGTIITSPDGINWTARPSPTSYSLNDVIFGNSTFIAVGNDAIQSDPIIEETISMPNTPNGPENGITNTNYTYSTGGSFSNLAHVVEYQFDWKGDGTILSPWGPATQSKTWTVAGSWSIKARARCTIHTSVVSGWSSAISVAIFTPGIYVGQDGLCGSKSLCFTSIQNGIDSAQSFTIIKITQETYNENIILDEPKMLIIQGGWDAAFSTNQSYTIINGSVTISDGTLIVENIVLK